MTESFREKVSGFFRSLQTQICQALEEADGKETFGADSWERPGGGGGLTRVLEAGKIFEKAGVNFSEVFGPMPETMAAKMNVKASEFYATGISLVIHPRSPMIPTVHANLRYFEMENGDSWFGGGSDLTPYYPYEEDCRHFHSALKSACDMHDGSLYPRFKKWCDEYFFVKHRGESRGAGGIFFDYIRNDREKDFGFVQSVGKAFLPSYLPIVKKRRDEPWGDRERGWQLVRRGRYVEFNLVYDRGTLFGLETDGRIESILMSLPPLVRWGYDSGDPEKGTREAELLNLLREPRDWVPA